ncbi:MAG: PD-(D/E)XK nuclease family protein [Pseudohongiellaceae bacterium]
MTTLSGKLDPLLADPRFETLKRTAMSFNTLHIRSFNENRHSEMLAWLLDPNEAHGLGDRFLRRLLLKCLNAKSESGEIHKGLKGVSASDLQAYSMSQALVFNEVDISRNGRIDILVVEPSLGIVVAIENKYGAGETGNQLERYQTWIEKTFPDYSQVFIVLDAYDRVSCPAPWVGLPYDWVADFLDTVVSYQELHPRIAFMLKDYLSYIKEEEYDEWNQYQHDLLVELYEKHRDILTNDDVRPELLRHLFEEYDWETLGQSEWTATGGQSEIWIVHRYWSVFAALMCIHRLEPVKRELLNLDKDGKVEVYGRYLSYLPSKVCGQGFESDKGWALYFNIVIEKDEEDEVERLEPKLCFRFRRADENLERLRQIARYYGKDNYKSSGNFKFEPLKEDGLPALCERIQTHVDELAKRMTEARASQRHT